jgi:hypothetical protein
MATAAATQRRELAHRASNGIEVFLFWTKTTDVVSVAVIDSLSDEALEFEVRGDMAMDAFNHPYAYAATPRVRNVRAMRLSASQLSSVAS